MLADTVIAETSAIVANPEDAELALDELELEAGELAPDPEAPELLPYDAPETLCPTDPFTATTRPAMGAVSVAAFRFVMAVFTAAVADVTWFCAEAT